MVFTLISIEYLSVSISKTSFSRSLPSFAHTVSSAWNVLSSAHSYLCSYSGICTLWPIRQFQLTPSFCRETFLGYTATLVPLCIVWPLSHYSGLEQLQQRPCAPETYIVYSLGLLQEKFANPLSIILITHTLCFHHQKCFFTVLD